MYIAIEGVKGVGKSTLLQHVQQWLVAQEVDYSLLCPTRAMPATHSLEQAAQRQPHDDDLRQALYAARSNYHAARVDTRKPLILGDRSVLTSLVTRWPTATEQQPDYVRAVLAREHRIALPDHVILLDAPDAVLLQRLANRQRHYGKQDECIERLQAARAAYQQLQMQAERLGLTRINWHTLDATDCLPQLVQCMGEQILKLINKPCAA